ncbi:MAG: hypothetical protein IJU20_08730 [Clostridia bacterium]|nr:hypothetical protein [Clostridia bacterium]
MSKEQKQTKDVRLMVLIVAVIVAVLALGTVLILFAQTWVQNGRYRKAVRQIVESPGNVESVLVCEPLYDTGYPLSPGREVFLSREQDIKALAEKLQGLADSMRFSRKMTSVAGEWDLYVRFTTSQGILYLYLTDTELYFAKEGTRYVFSAGEKELQTLGAYLRQVLEEQSQTQ